LGISFSRLVVTLSRDSLVSSTPGRPHQDLLVFVQPPLVDSTQRSSIHATIRGPAFSASSNSEKVRFRYSWPRRPPVKESISSAATFSSTTTSLGIRLQDNVARPRPFLESETHPSGHGEASICGSPVRVARHWIRGRSASTSPRRRLARR